MANSKRAFAQSLPPQPRPPPGQPRLHQLARTHETPRKVKGDAHSESLARRQLDWIQGRQPKGKQAAPRDQITKIKPGIDAEMKGSIILDVPHLVEKRFPDELFHRLLNPQGNIVPVGPLNSNPQAGTAPDPSSGHAQSPTETDDTHDGPDPLVPPTCPSDMTKSSNVDNGQREQSGWDDKEGPPADPSVNDDSDGCSSSCSSASHGPSNPTAPSSCTSADVGTDTLTVHDMFNYLCETEPLYDVEEKKWIDWPDTSEQKKEREIADQLNRILERVRKFLYGTEEDDDDWVFSAEHADVALREGGITRKPDLALVPRKVKNSFGWGDVRSLNEVKSSDFPLLRLARESCKYIREMFRVNVSRRFCLLFSLIKTKMALIKYDRAGALVSSAFDIHEDPERFLRVIIGMAFGEDYYLGLDPSFWSEGEKDYIVFEDTKYEIERIVHAGATVRGRGTIALLVKDPVTLRRYVIKEQWVDRDRELKEVDILDKLKEKKRKVNQLVQSRVVAFKVGDGAIVLDSTERDREGVAEKLLRTVETRDHYRLLLTPYGENITRFRNLRELVSSFKDYAETIYELYKDGYYHRDISDNNLIIVEEEDGQRVGYLIDLDCATKIDDHQRSAKAELTGTTPFMPIEMLLTTGCKHEYYFDLESLFYVLVWICLLEDGPRWDGHYPRSKYVMKDSILEEWCGGRKIPERPDAGAYRPIASAKSLAVTNDRQFKMLIIAHLPEYFKPIEDLLEELRGILFGPKQYFVNMKIREDDLPAGEREDKDRVFRRFIGALERARDRLPADDTPYGAPQSGDARIAATKCLEKNQEILRDDSSDSDSANGDGDYVDADDDDDDDDDDGYISPSPMEGKGKKSAGTVGSQSKKRPGPESKQSSKRRRTNSIRSSVKRSRS